MKVFWYGFANIILKQVQNYNETRQTLYSATVFKKGSHFQNSKQLLEPLTNEAITLHNSKDHKSKKKNNIKMVRSIDCKYMLTVKTGITYL